jgi:hypothetical protein
MRNLGRGAAAALLAALVAASSTAQQPPNQTQSQPSTPQPQAPTGSSIRTVGPYRDICGPSGCGGLIDPGPVGGGYVPPIPSVNPSRGVVVPSLPIARAGHSYCLLPRQSYCHLSARLSSGAACSCGDEAGVVAN